MLGNPSLSIDYYNKVLSVEKRNKQALAELEVSKSVLGDLASADLALEKKQYHKVCVFDSTFSYGSDNIFVGCGDVTEVLRGGSTV